MCTFPTFVVRMIYYKTEDGIGDFAFSFWMTLYFVYSGTCVIMHQAPRLYLLSCKYMV